jgi:hypothetical protein
MTRRRKLLAAGAALAVVAVTLSFPAVHWPLVGWLRGEPFYRGRPASYWAAAVEPLSTHFILNAPAPGIECYAPDCLFPGLRKRLGRPVPSRLLPAAEAPFGEGDSAAVSVLVVLLRHPNESVQMHAAWALARVGPPARDAVPDLRELAARRPADAAAFTARNALRYIEARTDAAPQPPAK